MRQSNQPKLDLLDPTFSRQMTRYYSWMTSFGILLFGSTFLIAGCTLTGCLQLIVGIVYIPPLRKKITVPYLGVIALLVVISSLVICVVEYGS